MVTTGDPIDDLRNLQFKTSNYRLLNQWNTIILVDEFHIMWLKQCHKPLMTGNGLYIPPIKMVMTGRLCKRQPVLPRSVGYYETYLLFWICCVDEAKVSIHPPDMGNLIGWFFEGDSQSVKPRDFSMVNHDSIVALHRFVPMYFKKNYFWLVVWNMAMENPLQMEVLMGKSSIISYIKLSAWWFGTMEFYDFPY